MPGSGTRKLALIILYLEQAGVPGQPLQCVDVRNPIGVISDVPDVPLISREGVHRSEVPLAALRILQIYNSA